MKFFVPFNPNIMEGDITPSYDMSINGHSPFTSNMNKRSLNDAFEIDPITINSADIITPPNSTVRKSKKQIVRKHDDDGKEPLSPIQSSPIAPTAKRQRSEGCPRSNGNLSLDEILKSLEKRKLNNELDKKPPYSYAILICLSILQSPEGKLTLSQIYNWISTHFTFYKPRDASWQNSIRHNLSLNEAFIKTEKSSDGKGHFWEVKPLSMSKFFKGDVDGYDGIRLKIANIEDYFEFESNDNEDNDDSSSSSSSISTSELENENVNMLSAPSITFTSNDNDIKDINQMRRNTLSGPNIIIPGSKLKNKSGYSVSFAEFSKSEMAGSLDSNNLMKRTHTTLGFESNSDNFLAPTSRDFISFNDYNNNVFPNSTQQFAASPQNMKRYICSFNSSFDELSPRPFKTENSTLLGPFSNSPIPPSHSEKFTQLLPSNTNNASNIESEQLNLLKTPEFKRTHSLERTPNRFIATPKDNDSLLKKWQTPSHLFEDIYSSPMFKAMGNSSKVSATPGGSTLLKKFSPSKINSAFSNDPVKSKLTCGGLFGVDVYSVWQRATERQPSMVEQLTDSNELDQPFNSEDDSKR